MAVELVSSTTTSNDISFIWGPILFTSKFSITSSSTTAMLLGMIPIQSKSIPSLLLKKKKFFKKKGFKRRSSEQMKQVMLFVKLPFFLSHVFCAKTKKDKINYWFKLHDLSFLSFTLEKKYTKSLMTIRTTSREANVKRRKRRRICSVQNNNPKWDSCLNKKTSFI